MTPLNDEQKKLVEDNHRLAYFVANKWQKNFTMIIFEDILSACFFGLIKAGATFNPDLDIKFSTYSTRCMDNEVLMLYRKFKKTHEYPFSSIAVFDADFKRADYEAIQNFNLSYDDNVKELQDAIEYKKVYEELITTLNPLQRDVFVRHFNLGQTQNKIGEDLGLSQSYISRLLSRAGTRMAKKYKKLYMVG